MPDFLLYYISTADILLWAASQEKETLEIDPLDLVSD